MGLEGGPRTRFKGGRTQENPQGWEVPLFNNYTVGRET